MEMAKRSREESLSTESDIEAQSPRSEADSPYPSTDDSNRAVKYTQLDMATNDRQAAPVMRCHLPPHQPTSFSSSEEYEVHYQTYHVNRCSECRKNFPSDHYLSLHIAENHDPINEARRARGDKTYGCFVEDCDKLCSTPQSRRLHLFDKHNFPKYYDFFVVNDGIDKRNTMLRPTHRRRSSAAARAAQSTRRNIERDSKTSPQGVETEQMAIPSTSLHENTPAGASVDDITKSMSALKFIPSSVRFGYKGRSGFARRQDPT